MYERFRPPALNLGGDLLPDVQSSLLSDGLGLWREGEGKEGGRERKRERGEERGRETE